MTEQEKILWLESFNRVLSARLSAADAAHEANRAVEAYRAAKSQFKPVE